MGMSMSLAVIKYSFSVDINDFQMMFYRVPSERMDQVEGIIREQCEQLSKVTDNVRNMALLREFIEADFDKAQIDYEYLESRDINVDMSPDGGVWNGWGN